MKPESRLVNLSIPLQKDNRQIDLRRELLHRLNLSDDQPFHYHILKRSVDARRKNAIHILFSVEVSPDLPPVADGVCSPARRSLEPGTNTSEGGKTIGEHPVVVGTGPAGLFAALALCQKGYKPIVLERGSPMPRRIDAVSAFWRDGQLDSSSNVQFGEGGAGTFSDGKLTSRSKHPLVAEVFDVFVSCGAPPDIAYEQKPHLGTEKVRAIVCRMRRMIEAMGGSFYFNTMMTGLDVRGGKVRAVLTPSNRIDTDAVFLAIGHSSRDTYALLDQVGVSMEAKPFAIGLRIEHPQSLIDRAQYGSFAGHPELGAADYRLSWQDPILKRGIYSFCNCPGGVVVACSSEEGGVVTNGMSRFNRDSGWSNSGLVVTVSQADFPGPGPLAGVVLQRQIERRAYDSAGGKFLAPAQHVRDFIEGRPSSGAIESTYRPGVVASDLDVVLPKPLALALKKGLVDFSRKIRGFETGVLIGAETRTSSPVRIHRHPHTHESVTVAGLFPLGEGAGYAGGIVSSAVDGLKVVLQVAER